MSLESRPFTVGLVQMRCSTDSNDNLDRACALLRQAANGGAQVACLPELFRTQYFCQSEDAARFDLAEPIPGPTTRGADAGGPAKRGWSSSARSSSAAPPASTTTRPSSSTPTARCAVVYRKMHIPDDPLYYEKFYFTPGDLGFQAFDTSFARVGALVCWDQWYPEAARLTALQGRRDPLLSHRHRLASRRESRVRRGPGERLGNDAALARHRQRSLRGRRQPRRPRRPSSGGLEFWGGSFLADPFGRIIARAGETAEEVLIAVCDPRLQEETRRNWPFLRDRRIDAYGPITERFLD